MAAKLEKMRYLVEVPAAVPDGQWLVHNNVRPTRRLGSRGFRAWLSEPDAKRWMPCGCGWAPEVGSHYRRRGA